LKLVSTNYTLTVTNTLVCEHVGVRIRTDHPLRGDLRITLESPQGTRSVLQRFNDDTAAGPVDWTYYSTHHFLESSAGDWTISFSDMFEGQTGSVQEVSLILRGVEVEDSDRDGLDDGWESTHFESHSQGPLDDPDGDGANNAREQALNTDPRQIDARFELDLAQWNEDWVRLSWPGVTGVDYEVWTGPEITDLTLSTILTGRFPVAEWLAPSTNGQYRFFQVRSPERDPPPATE
jgi:subtilisin-like proprotein convertase family protein